MITTVAATAALRWTGVETSFVLGFQANAAGTISATYLADASPPGTAPTALTQGVNYSVTLDGLGNATATPLAGMPAAPGTVTFMRNTPTTQTENFPVGAAWPNPQTAFDQLALVEQELRRDLTADNAAALRTPDGSAIAALPATAARASMALGFDASGNPLSISLGLVVPATATALGSVKIGAGLAVAADGTVSLAITSAQLLTALDALAASGAIPTSLPATAGVLWNDGGTLSIS